jgi:hypothetical protein
VASAGGGGRTLVCRCETASLQVWWRIVRQRFFFVFISREFILRKACEDGFGGRGVSAWGGGEAPAREMEEAQGCGTMEARSLYIYTMKGTA